MSAYKEHYFASFTFRLFGCLLVTAFMSMMVSLIALFFTSSRWFMLVVQLCCCGMVYSLIYSSAWETGSKDCNRVAYDRLREDTLRGWKAAMLASTPWLLSSVGLILMKANVLSYGFLAVYRMVNAPYIALNQVLLSTNATVDELPWLGVLASAVLPLIAPAIAGFGYALGYRGTAVMHTLMYHGKRTSD